MSSLIDSKANDDAVPEKRPEGKVLITAEEWGAKARDKVECYHKVGHEFGAYVPAIDNITIWHLRDLTSGVKKRINGKDVKHLHVPFYESLTVDDFIAFIEDFPFVKLCLPDRENELKKLGR